MSDQFEKIRSTTVIAVKRNGKVAMAGDGQVTMGNTVMKGNARKVRRIFEALLLSNAHILYFCPPPPLKIQKQCRRDAH